VFRAVVLADEPMLTPAEFPQIAALVEGAPVPLRPAAEPPVADEALTLDVAPPLAETSGGDALAPFNADGDVRPLAEIEAEMIRLALDRYRGRMSLVARKLGIGRSTLYRKLKELGISDTVDGIPAE
jgi:DNA-binding NtrC family response regulator